MKRIPILNERYVVCLGGNYMQHNGVFSPDIRKARKFTVLETAVTAARTLFDQMRDDCKIIAIKVASRTLVSVGI